MLRVKKLGIEWGAAYEEAQPHMVKMNNWPAFTFYVSENYEVKIELPVGAKIKVTGTGAVVTIG